MNTFKIAIHDDNREFTFKVECGNYFEGLLFYRANFTQGYKKENWFSNADFSLLTSFFKLFQHIF